MHAFLKTLEIGIWSKKMELIPVLVLCRAEFV